MSLKTTFFALTLFTCPVLADLAPSVYTNGGPTQETLGVCIASAKRQMRLAGFTKYLDVIYDKSNSHSASIFAEKKNKPVSIAYRCMTDISSWTYGIAANDNDEAWDAYSDFYNIVSELLNEQNSKEYKLRARR